MGFDLRRNISGGDIGNTFVEAILLMASGVLCRSNDSVLCHGSTVISSIRLSERLYVILAIRAVCVLFAFEEMH